MTFMIMTGVSASADSGTSETQESLVAIDALGGNIRGDAVDVSRADLTVTASGTNVELSPDAADGIAIDGPRSADLGVGLPFANQADAAAFVDGTMVYDNNNGTTTTPLVQDDGAVQILTTIGDAGAPTAYEYAFVLDEGASLSLTSDGGATVLGADGIVSATIAAPWAYDATGASVPTWYEIQGDTLVQVVAHRSSSTAYPVVADPKISFGWAIYVKYNKSETATIAKYTPYGTVADGVCPFLIVGTPIAVATCAAALSIYAIAIDQTFTSAAASGKCVQFSEPYYPALPTMVAQLRWKVVSC